MNLEFQAQDGIYSYPINCPACQESPDAEPDENRAKDCETCKGIGEITLQITEEEFADLCKQYMSLITNEHAGCPFMGQADDHLEYQEAKTCPFSGVSTNS